MISGATFSDDRVYRYALWRIWKEGAPPALFIGLNPSTADEAKDDPTIRRCLRFAADWGYGGLVMCNLFAFRATDPRELTRTADPVGPDNDYWLTAYMRGSALSVAAWGAHRLAVERAKSVVALGPLHVLGLTAGGQPRHPLYMRADTRPVPWPDLRDLAEPFVG